jgi:phosphatidylinositol-bisphosphatase
MEMCDDDAIDVQDQCSKLKPKKKSLCRLLMQKKTKVGCLSAESEEISLEEDAQNNSPLNQKDTKHDASNIVAPAVVSPVKKTNSITKLGDNQNKDITKEIQETHYLGSPKDFSNSTKLSLCCAMTESSRSLNHQHSSDYHRSTSTERSDHIHQNATVSASSDEQSVNKRMQSGNKASSIDETHLSTVCSREVGSNPHLEENVSQSVPVSRQASLKISQSPSPSEISSCDSSPIMQMSSQAQLRRRLLSQRHSVDNLLFSSTSCPSPSLRHSSPESSRSTPDPIRGYKTRSSSHDTMLPPYWDAKDKRAPIPSRGNNGNLCPENGALRGIVASMDSLARNSLLAAQVLHLIPTTKARER